LAELRNLRSSVLAAWQTLPERVRRRAELQSSAKRTETSSALSADQMAEFVARELQGLEALVPEPANTSSNETVTPTTTAAIQSVLPIAKDDILRLARIHLPLRERLDGVLTATQRAALRESFGQLIEQLGSFAIRVPVYIADLETSVRVLQEFRTWTAGTQIHAGNFRSDLNEWLDRRALVDLFTRAGELVRTLEVATSRDWQPDDRDRELLRIDSLRPNLSDDLSKRLAELINDMNVARGRVENSKEVAASDAFSSAGTSAEPPKPAAARRRWLSPGEVEALDRAGALLPSAHANDSLGVIFVRALAKDREEKLADGAIGRSGGLDQTINEAAELLEACKRLQQATATRSLVGSDLLDHTGNLVRAAQDLKKKLEALPGTFFHELTANELERDALGAACNELLALVTPARWVYRDIDWTARIDAHGPVLGWDTDGAPASLLFNTAELNAFALVLFLLLAPRQPNDLRVLVLDDPLQNMDELTVVTLGRALAKLQKVYPPGWLLLAFFHGEDNVERLRHEAPSHVYHLPWLSSPQVGDRDPIVQLEHKKTFPSESQTLSAQLLEDVSSIVSQDAATT
jgi:hypothetical protein